MIKEHGCHTSLSTISKRTGASADLANGFARTLSDEDLGHIKLHRRPYNRFRCALQLCVLRYHLIRWPCLPHGAHQSDR
ncbi:MULTISPECIES: DUF4158 domain-containing protein [unclassified Ochrobactrum]|uniref:DUF4158 domain-containing protein n=1 Tax=unclassified Ochrobactrum TaxID=239106 RepID=UPI0013C46A01|nr:DUF4158 domain-containing protein [Ochrobactrum sp. MC-1LL]